MGNQCQWHLWFVLAITCFVSQNYVAGELERVHLKGQPRNGNSSKGDGFPGFLVVGDWGRKGAFNQSRVAFQFWGTMIIGVMQRLNSVLFSDKLTPDGFVYDPSSSMLDVECALRESTAKWKIVVGHHAIRSIGFHGDTEELVNYLLPILKANNVDFYINGHDHCLQHISDTNGRMEFLTSGAGSKAWRGDMKKQRREGLRFFYDGQGFMSLQLSQFDAHIAFYDAYGTVLHTWNVWKPIFHSSM